MTLESGSSPSQLHNVEQEGDDEMDSRVRQQASQEPVNMNSRTAGPSDSKAGTEPGPVTSSVRPEPVNNRGDLHDAGYKMIGSGSVPLDIQHHDVPWFADAVVYYDRLESRFLYPERPHSVNYSSSSTSRTIPGRRPNPKSIETRRTSPAGTFHSDLPQIDNIPRAHVKEAGNVFRICDAVPYLLGPGFYLDAFVRLDKCHISAKELKDDEGNSIMNPHRITPLDYNVLSILMLLRTPENERLDATHGALRSFTTHEDRLIVYKDYGLGKDPEIVAIHYSDFVRMAIAWETLPNPAMVANDRPNIVTSWSIVVQMLKERNIDIRNIDSGLYYDLTSTALPDLSEKLEQLVQRGRFEKPRDVLEANRRALASKQNNTFHYVAPQETNRNVPYAMRFSHEHPRGYILDTTRPHHDTILFPDSRVADQERNKPTVKDGIETLRQKRMKWAKTTCGKATKWTLLLVIGAGVIAMLLLFTYFKIGNKSGKGFGQE